MKNNLTKISKKMSYLLRHDPQHLEMDDYGFVKVDDLLSELNNNYKHYEISLNDLYTVVQINDKQRFRFNDDKTQIKANQGHSLKIKHDFEEKIPPVDLFHGAPLSILDTIQLEGLKKMNRHHVHLSVDIATAAKVGSRRGRYTILTVNALTMYNSGYKFFITHNGVWLTDYVPIEFINVKI